MSETFECLGFACLAAFCYFIWPPSALIPAAILFFVLGFAADGVSFAAIFANLTPKMRRKRAENEPN